MKKSHHGLLAEIEQGALDESVPLSGVLRKCISLGGHAHSLELSDWARKELQGYKGELPDYRIIHAPMKIDGQTSGALITGEPVGSFDLPEYARKHITNEVPVAYGVAQIESLVRDAAKSEASTVKLQHPGAQDLLTLWNHELRSHNRIIRTLYWDVHVSGFESVLSHIRTTLVSLIAEMRAATPGGEELPSPEAAANAVNVVLKGGRRNSVTVMANNSSDQSTISVNPVEEKNETGWTKTGVIWGVIGGIAGVGGLVFAYLQYLA